MTPRGDYSARQMARVVFGAVLVIGACVLVYRVWSHRLELHEHEIAAGVLSWTWLVAIIAALVAHVAVSWSGGSLAGEKLLRASLVVPAAGLALVLPLTIHLLWFRFVEGSVAEFDEWASLSMVFAGPAHVTFLITASRRASQLARGEPAMSVPAIYGLCVVTGMAPLPVIPSILIALTGLPILPLLYGMAPLAAHERAALDTLPRAQLHAA